MFIIVNLISPRRTPSLQKIRVIIKFRHKVLKKLIERQSDPKQTTYSQITNVIWWNYTGSVTTYLVPAVFLSVWGSPLCTPPVQVVCCHGAFAVALSGVD